MGVCALDRYVKQLAAQDVGSARASGDHRGARAVGAGIRSLRPAEAELHDRIALRRIADAGSLRRDQALVVDDVKDRSLHELGLHDRRNDLDERLAREDQRSLRDRPDVAGELELREIVEEVFIEDAESGQVIDILLGKVQFLDVFDELLQARHDGVAAAERIDAEERVEDDRLVLVLVLEVALHHREFIKICQKCKILSVHDLPTSLRQNPRMRFCRMRHPVRQHRQCSLKVLHQQDFRTFSIIRDRSGKKPSSAPSILLQH